ncbi:hypothetical protein OPS25_13810 [Alteromonas ponticola]|uniref:Uncharacterized protein n=1 Tax=Alteromonas aquimaris TaxID=2998417 RepID=A0ABT3PA54_9ALTE|nr:hypothetical protein [Alteromonas aquimaris]MCW8109580.1 hypothetical protein [Alteromonas aquimaris]
MRFSMAQKRVKLVMTLEDNRISIEFAPALIYSLGERIVWGELTNASEN